MFLLYFSLIVTFLVFWLASFVLTVLDWRNGKALRPRDPPFVPPADDAVELDEEESLYDQPSRKTAYEHSNDSQGPFSDSNRYSGVPTVAPSTNSYATAPQLPRQSFDSYGAFSDPAPTGFTAAPGFTPSLSPPPEVPRVSRTMQYADPYARVRDAVSQPSAAPPPPPTYSSYNPYP